MLRPRAWPALPVLRRARIFNSPNGARIMNQQIQFQLERWTGREYVPHGAPHITTNPHTASNYAETARMLGLPSWRMVRTGKPRPAKARRWSPRCETASQYTRESVQDAYLAWAKSAGLRTVHVYTGHSRRVQGEGAIPLGEWAERLGFANVWEVDPDEILGPVYPDLELAEAA